MSWKNDVKHFGQILAAHSVIEVFKVSLGAVLFSLMTFVVTFLWNVMTGVARPEAIHSALTTFTCFLLFLLAVWSTVFVAVRTWIWLTHPKQGQLSREAVPANRNDSPPRLEHPDMVYGVANLPPGMRCLFMTGKWLLKWSGPSNGSEAVTIDEAGIYHTGNVHYQLELLKFIPGKRIIFLKHFTGTNRIAELNDLAVHDGGRTLIGSGSPDQNQLRYERQPG